MNKTLIPLPLALALALGLGSCSRHASDQPEDAAANAPSTSEPLDRTAEVTAPTGNGSADATAITTGVNPTADATGDAAVDGGGVDANAGTSAMGGSTIGGNEQYAANLEEALRRCDQLSGAERDTCRADAQGRYDQDATPATP